MFISLKAESNWWEKATKIIEPFTEGKGKNELTVGEIGQAFKEALQIGTENVVSQLGSANGFNNLGLNGFFQVGMTDLLENHRIIAGFRIPLNLNNIEYLFSYANLKRRLDKEIVFVRQATENEYYYGFYTFIERFRSYQLYYILIQSG